MKSVISIGLLLVLLIPAALKVAVVANYFVDYNTYLMLCENKDKPELKCNGKCHLAAELKQVSDPIDSPTVPKVLNAEPLFFFQESGRTDLGLVAIINNFPIKPAPAVLDGVRSELLDPPRV